LKAGDTDDSGHLDLADPLFLLNYLFRAGPAPGEPFAACGVDATADELTCATPAC
jgi:hypothetical protein